MRIRLLAAFLMTAVSMFLLSGSAYDRMGDKTREGIEAARMKNVSFSELFPPTGESGTAPEDTAPASETAEAPTCEREEPDERELAAVSAPIIIDSRADEVMTTTISGGISVKNETGYTVDAADIAETGPGLTLKSDSPQILIIHTHSSEAYTPAGLDRYEESDTSRTEDTEFNIIRVGDELTALLEQAGLNVIHDRGIYDYPSYTGSYNRSGAAIEEYLAQYPDIAVVLDIHRDALAAGEVVYKTMAEETGTCASQIMLLVGTDESGLEHPHWRRNLALALYLQAAVSEKYPTLMRPVDLVPQRYNQHLTTGLLIVEVGSSGNTLQEALAAIRLFAAACAPALKALEE